MIERERVSMPIFVKNVIWSQTESQVTISVQIIGRKSLEGIVIDEKFLKINIHPYFYELFFEQPICVAQSSCKILESVVRFRLKKVTDGLWRSLGRTTKPDGYNEEVISMKQKKEIFGDYEKRIEDDLTRSKNERANFKREQINKQMERESCIRKRIDEIEASLKELEASNVREKEPGTDKVSSVSGEKCTKVDKCTKIDEREEQIKSLPPIRQSGTINFGLSVRQFITPKRESQEVAEREWCAKQHEIMVTNLGFSDKDLNGDERDIGWLLNKGNEFLAKKNYFAAVSAFSCGMKISTDSPELYLGRAKAQYELKNYARCAQDTSDALERFIPVVDSNLLSRIHCYWLRGKSLIFLGLEKHGVKELNMARQLDPQNYEINQNNFMNA